MRRLLVSLLIIIVLVFALREVALRNLPAEPSDQLLSFYQLINADQYRLYSVDSFYKVYLNISESPMMYARAVGTYEANMFNSMRSRLKPGMTFIDVGANKGDHAFFAGHLVGSNGKVIAIEPVPENIHWLNKSLTENELDNVELQELALSDQDGHAMFQFGDVSGWGGLIPDEPELKEGRIEVRTAALDSLVPELGLSQVDAMKIDVEGAEIAVVRGAQETIDRFRPVIWLELHAQEDDADVEWLSQFFTQRDYRIIQLSTRKELPGLENVSDRLLLVAD